MKIEKGTAVSRTTDHAKTNIIVSIEFAVRASLPEEYVDSDFVHSILGRVFAESEHSGDGEDAGYIKASLVQFGGAMDHGIIAERLGDGIDRKHCGILGTPVRLGNRLLERGNTR
jgi:hypothetical protein